MALEIIKNITETEKNADNIRTQALQDAEKLKVDASNKGKDIIIKSRQQSKIATTKLITTAVESAQKEVGKILSQADKDCDDINKLAAQKMSEAVEAVVGKVVGINVNS